MALAILSVWISSIGLPIGWHLVQRADYPSGIEIVWRNGLNDPDGDPGDHRIKLNDTPIVFSSSNVYHFQLDWTTVGYSISVNGTFVMGDGWGYPYAPPNMRVFRPTSLAARIIPTESGG